MNSSCQAVVATVTAATTNHSHSHSHSHNHNQTTSDRSLNQQPHPHNHSCHHNHNNHHNHPPQPNNQQPQQPQPQLPALGGCSCSGASSVLCRRWRLKPILACFPAAQGEDRHVPGHTDFMAGLPSDPIVFTLSFSPFLSRSPCAPRALGFLSLLSHQPPLSFLYPQFYFFPMSNKWNPIECKPLSLPSLT